MKRFLAVLLLLFFVQMSCSATYVKGYYKKDGTYVSSHYRKSPSKKKYGKFKFPKQTTQKSSSYQSGKMDF